MAYINETPEWVEQIRKLERTDRIGGINDPQKDQARDLANRTLWLKRIIETVDEKISIIIGTDSDAGDTLKSKLDYLKDVKDEVKEAIASLGIDGMSDTTFNQYAKSLSSLLMDQAEVTQVVNSTWFNPIANLGGITWQDPTINFEYIEITDLDNPLVPAIVISAGTRKFTPTIGTHTYKIKTVFPNNLKTAGILLPQTDYVINYLSNLISATVPLNDYRELILKFDNAVLAVSGTGLLVNGNKELTFLEQISLTELRFRLTTGIFEENVDYTVSFNGLGSLKHSDNSFVAAWVNFAIDNNSLYKPANIVKAWVPNHGSGTAPSQLNILFDQLVNAVDYTKFTLVNSTSHINGVSTPNGEDFSMTVVLELDEEVDEDEHKLRLNMISGGALDAYEQSVIPFTNAIVENRSTVTAAKVEGARLISSTELEIYFSEDVEDSSSGITGLSVQTDAATDINIVSDSISEFTLTLTLDRDVYAHETLKVIYDGSDVDFVASSNSSRINAFTFGVANASPLVDITEAESEWEEVDLMTKFGIFDLQNLISELKSRMESGNYSGLKIGNYLTIEDFTIDTVNHGSQIVEILGFNSYRNFPDNGDNNFNHIIFGFRNIVESVAMDSQNSTIKNGFDSTLIAPRLSTKWVEELETKLGTILTPLNRNVDNSGGSAGNAYLFTKISYKVWLPTVFEIVGRKFTVGNGDPAQNGVGDISGPDIANDISSTAPETELTHKWLAGFKIRITPWVIGSGAIYHTLLIKNKNPNDPNNIANAGWWLQTGIKRSTINWLFVYVESTGALNSTTVTNAMGIVPCFAID